MSENREFKLTQVRSEIGTTHRVRQTLRALGLTGRGKSATVRDTVENRGRLRLVAHLVEVGE